MASKAGLKNLGGQDINDAAIVNTFHVECPRCKNKSLKKTAGIASESISDSIEESISKCTLFIISCPHCGFWVNTGFMHKSHKSKIEYLKSIGFIERPHRDVQDYVAMSLILESNGSCIMVRKDGSINYMQVGGEIGNFPDEEIDYLRSTFDISETLDKSKTYLSRWKETEKRLEVFCGSVPDISLHSNKSYEWEDSLVKPNIRNLTPEEIYQFIGIFLHDNK